MVLMVSGGGCRHELQTGCSGLPLYRQVDSDPTSIRSVDPPDPDPEGQK